MKNVFLLIKIRMGEWIFMGNFEIIFQTRFRKQKNIDFLLLVG